MLTPLEQAVVDTLLDKQGEPFDSIRQQLTHATITHREFTGVGFFTHFTLSDGAPVRRDLPDATIGDVGAEFRACSMALVFSCSSAMALSACWRVTPSTRRGPRAQMSSEFTDTKRPNHAPQRRRHRAGPSSPWRRVGNRARIR
jgi:hypothetical protein